MGQEAQIKRLESRHKELNELVDKIQKSSSIVDNAYLKELKVKKYQVKTKLESIKNG